MYYEKYEELCKLTGKSSYEVAKSTGINSATFTNWKKGKYTPKIETLRTIADFFSVPVTYFTGNEEDEKYIIPDYDPRIHNIIDKFGKMTEQQKDIVINLCCEFYENNTLIELGKNNSLSDKTDRLNSYAEKIMENEEVQKMMIEKMKELIKKDTSF